MDHGLAFDGLSVISRIPPRGQVIARVNNKNQENSKADQLPSEP